MMIAALMVVVGLGTFVIGPLRAALLLTDLYRLSSLYLALALVLGLAVLGRRGHLTLQRGSAESTK